jgi:hypothetical protein
LTSFTALSNKIDAKDTSVIESMYMLMRNQEREKMKDTHLSVSEYKKNQMNTNRLVAKLEKSKFSKKNLEKAKKTPVDFLDTVINIVR